MSKKLYACCVVRDEDGLIQSYSLTIESGKVTAISPLTRAKDLPAVAIGLAQRDLWQQSRVNREMFDVSKSKV